MKKLKHELILLCLFASAYHFTGCTAAQYGGDIIRSGQKDFKTVITQGITSQDISKLSNICMVVNGLDASGKPIIFTGGQTNLNVFTDMFIMEFMKKGYIVSTLSDNTGDITSPQKLDTMVLLGYNLVLICNMNLAASTSITDVTLGGEYSKAGVNSFTLKGIRTSDKKILFISSGEYGKAKGASDVSEDVVSLFSNICSGKIKK